MEAAAAAVAAAPAAGRARIERLWPGAVVFDHHGEQEFRVAEADAIAEVGGTVGPLVVSVGGGAVLSEVNRRAMRELGTVVWLRARPATLAERVGEGLGRPLIAGAPNGPAGPLPAHEVLARLDSERRPLYEEVADIVVDVDDLSAAQVARRVLAALAERGRWAPGARPG